MNRAYLDQTAASRDWFSSCIWTCALPRRGLAAGFVLNPLHGVRHAAISVWHRFFFLVRLQAHPSSSWRSFPSSNRWTDGALLLSEFRHGATFESLSSLESSGAPSATALHTDTDVPSCEASDRRAEETSLSLSPLPRPPRFFYFSCFLSLVASPSCTRAEGRWQQGRQLNDSSDRHTPKPPWPILIASRRQLSVRLRSGNWHYWDVSAPPPTTKSNS